VRPETFIQMLSVLEQKAQQKRKAGRPLKMGLPDRLLMTLQYWREYRTYFHIAQSWGVNESTAHRIIRAVEDTLIQSGRFSLPGKKTLHAADTQIEVIVIDVTETPSERPQKTTFVLLRQEKTSYPQSSGHRRPSYRSDSVYRTQQGQSARFPDFQAQ
jgi:Helix-turn-helix of DDE superfamily endonuclease